MKLNLFTRLLREVPKLTHNQKHLLQHRLNGEINRGGVNLKIDKCKGDGILYALIVMACRYSATVAHQVSSDISVKYAIKPSML
jgi:hypothetical protein